MRRGASAARKLVEVDGDPEAIAERLSRAMADALGEP
jgi:hypothetical protein